MGGVGGGSGVAPGVCMWAEARAVQGEGPSGGDWERQLELRVSGHKGCALGHGGERPDSVCI